MIFDNIDFKELLDIIGLALVFALLISAIDLWIQVGDAVVNL